MFRFALAALLFGGVRAPDVKRGHTAAGLRGLATTDWVRVTKMFGAIKGGFLNKRASAAAKQPAAKPNAASGTTARAAAAGATSGDGAEGESHQKGEEEEEQEEDVECLRGILRLIRERRVELKGGYVHELLLPRTFRREVYPLDADADVRAKGLPATLDEFLQGIDVAPSSNRRRGGGGGNGNGNGSRSSTGGPFTRHILEAMPAVRAKAESILAGVARRAREAGEMFDEATAQILRPQVRVCACVIPV